MAQQGFFPTSYDMTRNQTHVSLFAPLLSELHSGRLTDGATAAATTLKLDLALAFFRPENAIRAFEVDLNAV